MTPEQQKTILYCIIVTELTILGALVMFGLALDIVTGFAVWGSILAMLCYACYKDGFLSRKDGTPGPLYFTALINGMALNTGLYLIAMIVLRFQFGIPIMIGGM